MSTYGFGGGYGDALINAAKKKKSASPEPVADVPTPVGDVPGPSAPGAPGGGFDFRSNPYYQQVLAAVNAGGAADAAATRAGIQRALIGFGFVPGGFKDSLGALDDLTKSLIEKNTSTGISGYARLLEGRSEGIRGLINRLQARGLRRSGAKGYGLRKNQLAFDRNFADAVSNLLGQTGGMYGAYAQNEYARQQQLADAMRWVFQNYFTYADTPEPNPGPQAFGSSGYTPTGGVITDYSGNPSRSSGGNVWTGWTPY